MGFPCVLDTTGCEGWSPLSGHLLHVSGMLTSVSSVCRTPGVAGVCCAAVCHRVVAVGPVARRGSGSWGGVPCVAPGRRGGY